jgi:hypothetical protein
MRMITQSQSKRLLTASKAKCSILAFVSFGNVKGGIGIGAGICQQCEGWDKSWDV